MTYFKILYKKLADVLGIMLLFIGFVLAFLPHVFHSRIGLNEATAHTKHVATGIILVVLGLAILIYNNNALRPLFRKKI